MDAALRSLLDWYAEMGVDVPKVPDARPARAKRVAPKAAATAPRADTPSSATAIDLSKVKTLDALREAMDGFDAGPLTDSARQAVFSHLSMKTFSRPDIASSFFDRFSGR